jgi:hypothetical protein
MKMCQDLNTCSKIRMIRDHDWACDAQFTEAVMKTCDKCDQKK